MTNRKDIIHVEKKKKNTEAFLNIKKNEGTAKSKRVKKFVQLRIYTTHFRTFFEHSYFSDKGLIPTIYMELKRLTSKRTNEPVNKLANKLKR
jgi:hypothetical protein